jgi:cytochrome c oxidase subunit 1
MIGIGYFMLGLGCMGGAFGMTMLMRVGIHVWAGVMAEGVVTAPVADGWTVLSGIHGLIMIFWAIMPMVIGGASNYIVPNSVGEAEVVWPRMNALSIWVWTASLLMLMVSACGVPATGAAGWTLYAPLSGNSAWVWWLDVALLVNGMASLFGGSNMIWTIAGSHVALTGSWMETGMMTLSQLGAALLLVGTVPVLGAGLWLISWDNLGIIPALDWRHGADSLVWQHLFWIFGHPEVYVVLLPVVGWMGQIALVQGHESAWENWMVAQSMVCVALLGLWVWGHHMYVAGLEVDGRIYFAVVTTVIAVPTSQKALVWAVWLVGGAPHRVGGQSGPANIGSVGAWIQLLFVIGGVTGVATSSSATDIVLHDTYFIVGHFHWVMAAPGLIVGVHLAETVCNAIWAGPGWGWSLVGYDVGLLWVLAIFASMHIIGVAGGVRRVPGGTDAIQSWHLVASMGLFGASPAGGGLLLGLSVLRSGGGWRV